MINIEYKRLKSLFSLVDESKTELVDNLIHQAAFMKVELDKLQEQIKKQAKELGFNFKLLNKTKIPFEELYVYEFS